MTGQTEIRYIRFYTDGSAARELEHKSQVSAPSTDIAPRKKKRRVRRIYPVEILACATAVVMAVFMITGMIRCFVVNQENRALASYVEQLESRNAYLSEQYTELVDLAEVEKTALAIGMVPAEAVETIPIHISAPVTEPEPGVWQRVTAFLTALFA